MTTRNILILYYSRHGHTAELARHIARGVNKHDPARAILRTVPPVNSTTEVASPPLPEEGAPYATLDDLAQCDALALGSPAYFGNMASPLKFFLEQTSPLWLKAQLVGKPATVFTSAGGLHGGQESTLLTMMLPLFHHGMIICPLSYDIPALNSTKTGGTPYGSSYWSGIDGSHALSDEEQILARCQGEKLAALTLQLNR